MEQQVQDLKNPIERRLLDIGDDCATLVLGQDGVVTECSNGALRLFRANERTIIGRHISDFIPRFSRHELVRAGALEPQLDYLCHCGAPFRARRTTGEPFVCELYFHDHDGVSPDKLRLIVREVAAPDLSRTGNSWCLE